MVQPPHKKTIRHIIRHKYVNKNPCFLFQEFLPQPHMFRILPPYLCPAPAVIRITLIILKKKTRRIQLFLTYPSELCILFSEHNHINIIIPRDKSFVADCAQQRTAIQRILNIVLLADSVHLNQHFQLNTL